MLKVLAWSNFSFKLDLSTHFQHKFDTYPTDFQYLMGPQNVFDDII